MDLRNYMKKPEDFAKKVIKLAAEEKLTIDELSCAANMIKDISGYSVIDAQSIERRESNCKGLYSSAADFERECI